MDFSNPSNLSCSSLSSVSSLPVSSNEGRGTCFQEEYENIDRLLKKAQEDLTTISSDAPQSATRCPSHGVSPSPTVLSTSSSSCDDFTLSSTDHDYLDLPAMLDQSHAFPVQDACHEFPMRFTRAERPGTLSRPVLLPSCCNFKAKPWHTLVTGDYSYSKFPSGEAENETDSSRYKKDLDDIMRELESYLERDKNGNVGKSQVSLFVDAERVKGRSLSPAVPIDCVVVAVDAAVGRNIKRREDPNHSKDEFFISEESLDSTNNNSSNNNNGRDHNRCRYHSNNDINYSNNNINKDKCSQNINNNNSSNNNNYNSNSYCNSLHRQITALETHNNINNNNINGINSKINNLDCQGRKTSAITDHLVETPPSFPSFPSSPSSPLTSSSPTCYHHCDHQRPKRRSRTLSPACLNDGGQSTSRVEVSCPPQSLVDSKPVAIVSDTKVDGSSLRRLKKRSHYGGLKTNGCLRSRDPVAVQNRANEILLQKYQASRANGSNQFWPSGPAVQFDRYKIEPQSNFGCRAGTQRHDLQSQFNASSTVFVARRRFPPQTETQPSSNQNVQIQLSTPPQNSVGPKASSSSSSPFVLTATGRRSSNPFSGRRLRLSKENLLDKLHRTFYPGLYRTGSTVNNSSSVVSSSASSERKFSGGRRASLDNNDVTGSSPSTREFLCRSGKNQEFVHGRLRPLLTKTSCRVRPNADLHAKANNDTTKSLPVTPAKDFHRAPDTPDQKLQQACTWFVMSGFPQYVQMYKDEKLPIPLEQLVEDHHFLEDQDLELLKKRMLLLNQLSIKKVQIPPAAYSKMASFPEFQHCLSCRWSYDKLSCSWLRTPRQNEQKLSRTSTKESLSSSPSTSSSSTSSSSSSSTSSTMSGNNSTSNIGSGGSKSKPAEIKIWEGNPDQIRTTIINSNNHKDNHNDIHRDNQSDIHKDIHNDSNSLHTTSGYESEVSPVSTNSKVADVGHVTRASSAHASGRDSPASNSAASFGPTGDDHVVVTSSMSHGSSPEYPSPGARKRSGFYDNEPDEALLQLDLILEDFYRVIGESTSSSDQGQGETSRDPDNQVSSFSPGDQNDQVFVNNCYDNRQSGESNSELEERTRSNRGASDDPESVFTDEWADMDELTASQFVVVRKLSALKLSGIFDKFELHSDFMSSMENPREPSSASQQPLQDKLFCVPPSSYLRRTGHSVPPSISGLMDFIESSSRDCVGIFRKPGVQSRILSLQKQMDLCADVKFDIGPDVDPYDAADVFKRYLRDLPETLLTDRLCPSFSLVFSSLPSMHVTECLQHLMILLPDVNRTILFHVFHFLHNISRHSALNQMTPANLAVCFLPSLFRMTDSSASSSSPSSSSGPGSTSGSCALSRSPLSWDHKSALICLTRIIENPRLAFCVPRSLLEIANGILVHLSTFTFVDSYLKMHSLQQTQSPDYITRFLFSSMKNFNSFRGWTQIKVKSFPDVTLFVSTERNDSFLSSWKCRLEVLAPPVEVINKIHKDSQPWVGRMLDRRILERKTVEEDRIHHEVVSYHFLLPRDSADPTSASDSHDHARDEEVDSVCEELRRWKRRRTKLRRTCELRAWKTDLPKESCFYCSKSILDARKGRSRGDESSRDVHVTESSFFLEPCGGGLTSLTHVSTVDLIGHSCDWYEAVFPLLVMRYFSNLQLHFKRQVTNATGPETKV